MNISLNLSASLTQTLTPQQVQYLKLLQLTNMQLEHHIQQEIESNPMLEETDEHDLTKESGDETDEIFPQSDDLTMIFRDEAERYDTNDDSYVHKEPIVEKDTWQDYIDDEGYRASPHNDDDDEDFMPVKSVTTFVEELIDQLRFIAESREELMLGEEIIWNIEPTGYLERDLQEIIDTVNTMILEENRSKISEAMQRQNSSAEPAEGENMAADSENSELRLAMIPTQTTALFSVEDYLEVLAEQFEVPILHAVTLEQAETLLKKIQRLEPHGVGSRNLQECLLVQLYAFPKHNAAQKLAVEILTKTYDAFRMKHFDVMLKELHVTEDYLREALDEIRSLNPKPGDGSASLGIQSVIPDFWVENDDENDDIIVHLNDGRIPSVRINKEYERIRKEARRNKFNQQTRVWLKNKYDDAKFLIQALKQRSGTMQKVATAIVFRQREFFKHGEDWLKPLIYKNVSEDTGMDISTVCRVVNGKYIQTEYGIFELRFFFSESLANDDGEEISTKVIKNKLRELIESEKKRKPMSDELIAEEMNKIGYNLARRTVAKYREQMNIPVARLRKEL